MTYEFLAIILLVVGCGLIVAEVFIPSGGMILILCVLTFIASMWCAYKAWWGQSPAIFATYIAGLLVLIPGVLIGVYKVLNDTKVGDRILLAAPDLEDVTPYRQEQAHLEQLIGQIGTAVTPMNPGGMVSVAGERLHAFTEGLLVPQGGSVEVVAVRGTRIVVRPHSAVAGSNIVTATPAAVPAAAPVDASAPPPLDFDVPQS
ncbi:MAG: NfeD family protein [Planctomycetaceae bacterium]